MNRARQAAKHSLFMVISQILCMLLAIGSILFYTRVLSPLDLALIAVYGMLSSICYTISDLGLGLYIQRRMPEINEQDPVSAMLLGRAMVRVVSMLLVVCCSVLYLTSEFLADRLLKDPVAARYLVLLIPAVAAGCWRTLLVQILQGQSLFPFLSAYNLTSQIIQPVTVIVMFLWWGTSGLVLGLAVGFLVAAVVPTWRLRHFLFGRVSWRYVAGNVRRALPFYIEGYVGYLIMYADQWIVGLFLTPFELATYYVPKTLFIRLSTLMDGINSVTIANMSAIGIGSLAATQAVFAKIRRVYVYLYAPFCAILLGASFYLIDLLAGPRYPGGKIPFVLLCLALLVSGIYMPYSIGIMTWTAPRKRFFVVLFQGVMMIGAMVPLAWMFHLYGIAGSWFLARLAAGVFSAYLLYRIVPFARDWSSLGVVFVPTLLLLAISVAGQVLFYHWLIVPVYLTLGTLAYLVLFVQRISGADMAMLEDLMPYRLRWVLRLIYRLRAERRKIEIGA